MSGASRRALLGGLLGENAAAVRRLGLTM